MEAAPLILFSPHSREECVARLTASLDKEPFVFAPFQRRDAKPFIGSVTPTSLRVRKRINYGNSFQTVLCADLVARQQGTELRFATSRVESSTWLFMWLWVAAVLIVGGFVFTFSVIEILGKNPRPQAWMGVWLPLWVLGITAVMIPLGRWLARDEELKIIVFLKEVLDADVVR